MTEEEKRRIALSILEEQRSTPVFSAVQQHSFANLEKNLARAEKKRILIDSLEQNGITLNHLRDAYSEAFNRAREEMIDFRLAFFYAGVAISVKERMPTLSPEEVADFMQTLITIPGNTEEEPELIARARETTGVDVCKLVEENTIALLPSRAFVGIGKASRKDVAAINRMRLTGITEKDVAYEREIGYTNGRNSTFNHSTLYAALAIVLHQKIGADVEEIEWVIDRVEAIGDEEISAEDVLERAKVEAGVDVSELAKQK